MSLVASEPTIAAIATPPGPGGIGIIRVSGRRALPILRQLFQPRRPQSGPASHKLTYGWLHHPETGAPIDEVLAVYMRSPHTYTREDVVEIHCHSSYLVLQQILAAVLAAGARLAEPGEFTKRAFLNGRIDLTRAEAVLELLEARTEQGLALAVGQLQGGLQERVEPIRQTLVELRAILEVAIDFPEEEGEIIDPASLRRQLAERTEAPLRELIGSSERGRIFREGVSVVILGRPNVGKSSLLNSLLREERAIVTAVPGTTRDTIEEILDIKGIPVRIVDTAGIREASEAVEEIGIQRARQKVAAADLVLLLLDGSEPPGEADAPLLASIGDRPAVIVVNKTDIAAEAHLAAYREAYADRGPVMISARTGEGLPALEEAIHAAVVGESLPGDPVHACVPNLRHQAALRKTLAAVRTVMAGLDSGLPPDLLAIELQGGLDHLGDIVGETTTEDVLAAIFERFCIGK
ncbi:MAG: tRNA uridine-5-carboxymethylaminomethyl(34) synthesis GTPase MnmE [Desulfobacteraceae bacterium]|nr:tRNA uridine-5-carboxymethylaminomethyl(34) synthesis GTPase MnmE [Desulfobacteraceae bacterium]